MMESALVEVDAESMTNNNAEFEVEDQVSLRPSIAEPLPPAVIVNPDGSRKKAVVRNVVRAGGWGLAKRLIKPIPIVGSLLALALAAVAIKRKGFLRGTVHVGLDVTPVVGTAKNVVEIFTGDLIPDKKKNPND
jgi:hypothetical protein